MHGAYTLRFPVYVSIFRKFTAKKFTKLVNSRCFSGFFTRHCKKDVSLNFPHFTLKNPCTHYGPTYFPVPNPVVKLLIPGKLRMSKIENVEDHLAYFRHLQISVIWLIYEYYFPTFANIEAKKCSASQLISHNLLFYTHHRCGIDAIINTADICPWKSKIGILYRKKK